MGVDDVDLAASEQPQKWQPAAEIRPRFTLQLENFDAACPHGLDELRSRRARQAEPALEAALVQSECDSHRDDLGARGTQRVDDGQNSEPPLSAPAGSRPLLISDRGMRCPGNGYLPQVRLRRHRGRVLAAGAALLLGGGLAAAIVEVSQPGPHTFAGETAHLDTHPRPAKTHRTVRVTSARAFSEAVEHAHPGETILVRGHVSIGGEFTGFNRVVDGGTVSVLLGPQVRFTGGGASGLPAVLVRGAGGWRISGGTISNATGDGILAYALPGPFTWTGFRVRDTAGDCVAALPVGGNIDRLTLKGLTGSARPDLGLDPHSEKGTGIHAWNIGDAEGGLVENSVFAADVVDQATGAAVQIDTTHIGGHVTVYARAHHLGFAIPGTTWHGYARRQVAGNVVQLWGGTPPGALDLAYVEGGAIEGRLIDTSAISPGADLSRVRVGVARATGTILENPELSGPAVQLVDGMSRAAG